MGLANSACEMEEYIQFDKDKIGKVLVSTKVSTYEPDYPHSYPQPAVCARNYSTDENRSQQGFWLVYTPKHNKV